MQILKILKDRVQGKAPKGARRSPKWRQVRKEKLDSQRSCELCGSTQALEVHHIIPFHIAPDLELDKDNLIVLCENKKYGINCHLLVGHLGNYRKFNPMVKLDVLTWSHKIGKNDDH